MRLRSTLFFLVLFVLQSAQAQPGKGDYTTKKTTSSKARKFYDEGIRYFRKAEDEKALKLFEKALKADNKLIDARIQRAGVFYELKNYPAAEQAFEEVLEIDPYYKKKVLYTLGLTEMKMKKHTEAIVHFQQYLDAGSKNEVLNKRAARHIASCNFASEALKKPVPFEPKNLGANINTPGWEYLPSLTADEQTLVYTARVNGWEDFYMSKKVDGVWQAGEAIKDINTERNEGAQSISADGKYLVFTACDREDGEGKCDLYFSELKKGRWTTPQNMGPVINTPDSEKQPSISANGKTLYFASTRRGGLGGYDIWISRRRADGRWGKPVNAAAPINTPSHEKTPFIHPDGQTLYFMSDGHVGMGGEDLFFARKQTDGSWATPQNLGYPINTTADEFSLVVSLDGKTAYFASNQQFGAKGGEETSNSKAPTDLYAFELYPAARPKPVTYVKARVFDARNKRKLEANVAFMDVSSGEVYASAVTGTDGEFLICLPMGKDYALNVSKELYLFHSEHFALAETSSLDDPFLLEIPLQRIPEPIASSSTPSEAKPPTSTPIILRNVFFDTGSAALRQTSFAELDRLYELLNQNTQLRIQINGHTDSVGSEADNLKLSDDRAKAVHDYLIEKGIAADRLRFKGYGEGQPIEVNETAEGRQRNRRTEFIILP
ncbi:MAG: OmpA family protein [Bacteroidota bacterium]